jgi:hypothetical protein
MDNLDSVRVLVAKTGTDGKGHFVIAGASHSRRNPWPCVFATVNRGAGRAG